MKPTGKLVHFKNGGNSVLGLPVFTDNLGSEFVQYTDSWYHVSEVPLERLHTVQITPAVPRQIPKTI
jgi:hypothetical protein